MTWLLNPYRFAGADSLLTSLVAWWSLDETSGTRVNNHNPGTHDLTDNATVLYTTGVQGNAALAAAASLEFLSCATHADLIIGDRDYSIAGWFKFSSASNVSGGLINKNGGTEWTLRRTSSNAQVQFAMRDAANTTLVTTPSITISYDTFFFVVAAYDAANDLLRLEVNRGTEQTAALAGGGYTGGTGDFRILRSSNAYLDGAADEAAIWHRLLTTDEKDRLYNAGAGMAYPG